MSKRTTAISAPTLTALLVALLATVAALFVGSRAPVPEPASQRAADPVTAPLPAPTNAPQAFAEGRVRTRLPPPVARVQTNTNADVQRELPEQADSPTSAPLPPPAPMADQLATLTVQLYSCGSAEVGQALRRADASGQLIAFYGETELQLEIANGELVDVLLLHDGGTPDDVQRCYTEQAWALVPDGAEDGVYSVNATFSVQVTPGGGLSFETQMLGKDAP